MKISTGKQILALWSILAVGILSLDWASAQSYDEGGNTTGSGTDDVNPEEPGPEP